MPPKASHEVAARKPGTAVPKECGKGREPRKRRHKKFYSVITVDWPEMSNRLRQRRFLQAITSSLRTMYDRNLANRARSRSSRPPGQLAFLGAHHPGHFVLRRLMAMGTIQRSWFFLLLLVKKIALFHKLGVGFPGVAFRLNMNYCTLDVAYDS